MVSDLRGESTSASAATSSNNDAASEDVPGEAEMGALFEAAMRQQQKTQETTGEAPKVTPDEQQKFLSAMKDPEFRSLLNEYMREISDPRNRAETEQYLSQLEKEQKVPADKQLVKPHPGFVVKTKWETSQKVFVNVCSSDLVQPPSSTRVASGQQGTSWTLPYSLGPERLEPDKGGASVPTFDVCFHPRVVEFAMTRPDYKHMVISTCLDAVEPLLRDSRRKPKALLDRNCRVLKGVLYKTGDPVTMCLRKEREAPTPSTSTTSTTEAKPPVGDKENAPPPQTVEPGAGKAEDSVLNQLTHVEQTEKSAPLLKEVSSTKLDPKQQLPRPKHKSKMAHQLIYRGRFELLHHMQADPSQSVPADRYRPKELVVEVSFPLSSSAEGLHLDVSERMVRLSASASVPGDYGPLELPLPFPVVEDKGSAKFDRKNHKLVVTLPVQPPLKPQPQPVSLVVESEDEDEEEVAAQQATMEAEAHEAPVAQASRQQKEGEDEFRMLRETALMVANDPQVLAHKQRHTQRPAPVAHPPSALVTEPAAIKDDVFDDLPPLESCSDEEEDASAPTPTDAAEPIKPPFGTHDSSACLSYIVGVVGVDSASVQLTFPSASSLRVEFSDSNRRVYDMQVAVLPADVDPSTAEVDVADENMAIILQKKRLATASASKMVEAIELDAPAPAPPLAAARFQNQLLYELD